MRDRSRRLDWPSGPTLPSVTSASGCARGPLGGCVTYDPETDRYSLSPDTKAARSLVTPRNEINCGLDRIEESVMQTGLGQWT